METDNLNFDDALKIVRLDCLTLVVHWKTFLDLFIKSDKFYRVAEIPAEILKFAMARTAILRFSALALDGAGSGKKTNCNLAWLLSEIDLPEASKKLETLQDKNNKVAKKFKGIRDKSVSHTDFRTRLQDASDVFCEKEFEQLMREAVQIVNLICVEKNESTIDLDCLMQWSKCEDLIFYGGSPSDLLEAIKLR